MTAHWGIEDPASIDGEGKREAFVTALRYLRNRIDLFLELPIAALDAMTLQSRLRDIGATSVASAKAET